MGVNQFIPMVSIVIPVYNGSNYVKEAIDSALSQTYENIEVIVINDGSNDKGKTEKICKSYGKRIRYFKKENGGVASALNMGIEKMEGEYFSWLSHDDVYYPEKIDAQISFLKEIEDKNTVLYSNVEYIDDESKIISRTEYEKFYSKRILETGVFPVFYGYTNGCTILIPKKSFDKVGLFNEKLKTANDYDMWFRLFKKSPIKFIPQVLVRYRFHEKQGTRVAPKESRIAESDKIWVSAINDLSDGEVRTFGVEPVKFYSDLARRMEEASRISSYKSAMNKAIRYYKKNGPVVSIIMPCYNSEKYLREAVESILKQTYPNFELIIVDDDSSDNTWKIAQEYKDREFRVKITKNKYAKGIPGAMNTGLDVSEGSFITRMDSDDLSLPTRLEKQVVFLMENEEFGYCSTNMSAFGKIISPALYKKQEAPLEWLFFWSNPVPSAAAMYKAEIIRKNNIRFRDYKVAQDYEFLTQVTLHTKGYILYEESLYHYRIHTKSNFQKNFDLVLTNSREINENFIYNIVQSHPPSFHWDLTEFTIPSHGEKDLDLFEVTEWMNFLLKISKEVWVWDEEEYNSAKMDAQKRIESYLNARGIKVYKKELEQKEKEIAELQANGLRNNKIFGKYPLLIVNKYKRLLELIQVQGWSTTLKNILLKIKKR